MNTQAPSFRRALWPLALLSVLVFAPLAGASSDAPNVNVTMPSEGEALAKGFARAFDAFKGGPIFLTYEKEGTALRTLSGVRSVEAEGAVLIIETDRGTTIAIPAKRVLSMTDERPPAP